MIQVIAIGNLNQSYRRHTFQLEGWPPLRLCINWHHIRERGRAHGGERTAQRTNEIEIEWRERASVLGAFRGAQISIPHRR